MHLESGQWRLLKFCHSYLYKPVSLTLSEEKVCESAFGLFDDVSFGMYVHTYSSLSSYVFKLIQQYYYDDIM